MQRARSRPCSPPRLHGRVGAVLLACAAACGDSGRDDGSEGTSGPPITTTDASTEALTEAGSSMGEPTGAATTGTSGTADETGPGIVFDLEPPGDVPIPRPTCEPRP